MTMSGRSSLKRKLSDDGATAAASRPPQMPAPNGAFKPRGAGFWQNGLKVSMADPGQVLFSDADCVIIADKYPKAKRHYLAMPTRSIDSLARLTPGDATLLRRMLEAAKQFVIGEGLRVRDFRFGFHAVPSMSQLHMHVITQDFVSPCLKHKKHWLSFTSEFFIDCEALLQVLEPDDSGGGNPLAPRVTLRDGGGGLAIDTAWYNDQIRLGELKCNQCHRVSRTMPDLKAHLSQHQQSKAGQQS